MSRLFTSGFELNSTTATHEFTSTTGSPTIVAGGRFGSFVGRITAPTANAEKSFRYQFASANSTASFFMRGWLHVTTLPNVTATIMGFVDSTGNTPCGISLQTDGTLKLGDNAGSQVGSNSASINDGNWHCLEININTAGTVLEARLDGVVFATTAVADLGAAGAFACLWGVNLGGFDACNSVDIQWDDLAINSTTAQTGQTSYPGLFAVLCYKPSAAGDNNTFVTQTGGTAGSANNFTRVNETTPDDATTFNGDATTTHIDLYAMAPLGGTLPSGCGSIPLVQVNFRFRASVASALPGIKVEVEKTTGGTKSASTIFTPNATTWKTNTNAVPNLPPLTLVLDPDSGAWTPATIASMQVGILTGTGSGTTNRVDVSKLWAHVEFAPPPIGRDITPGQNTPGMQINQAVARAGNW